MKASDTVMTSRDAVFDPIQDQVQRLLITQAEISFKAGIKEAKFFVESHGMHLNHNYRDWQSKLKEWGISPV